MTGTVDELAYPLLLAEHGVPFWLLTLGFGHSDMCIIISIYYIMTT